MHCLASFQADAIPDWIVYIIIAPVFPTTGFIHPALGMAQACLLVGVSIYRIIRALRESEYRAHWFYYVYLPIWIIPNIITITWGILNDPAL